MRIGVCAGIDNIFTAERIGFDFIEWAVVEAAFMGEQSFSEVKKRIGQCSIKPEACNCFFPGDMKITGPELNYANISEYVKKALGRVASLGTSIVVVGSGTARRVPDGWSREDGIKQFGEVLAIIGEEGSQYGITAVVEHLSKRETNIINSVEEGIQLVKMINHPNVKLLADFYHMMVEAENMDSIIKAGDELRHVHIANSNGRKYPMNADEDKYQPFFNALKEIVYTDRISIEAGTENFEADAPMALSFLKSFSI